ncbi:MAG: hypothetical protein ACREC5_01830 [Thermoplasmata archaeon]
MCEICRDPSLDEESYERLPHEKEDPFLCEWPKKGDPALCGAPATWAVAFNFVEEHVCDAHREEEAAERSGGLAEMLRSTGLETGAVSLAIKEAARCDWSPPLGPSEECGKLAHWAVVIAAESCYCDEHMELYKVEQEKERKRKEKLRRAPSTGPKR